MVRYPGCACYWLEPTGKGRVGLRRFTDERCPKTTWGHDASRICAIEFPIVWKTDEDGYLLQQGVPRSKVPRRSDPRWPKRCKACRKAFPKEATWQSFVATEYVRSDTGKRVWLRHVMGIECAGAMYDVEYLHGEWGKWQKVKEEPDGIILGAVCPNGALWIVDAQASSGGYWTRSGDPRRPETLTASPSIVAGDYHGFLQAGRFTDDLGS